MYHLSGSALRQALGMIAVRASVGADRGGGGGWSAGADE